MWRKPVLIVNEVDVLIENVVAKAYSYVSGGVPQATDWEGIVDGGNTGSPCVLEKCWYLWNCDVLPVL